jgi:hypothetical protein
MSILFATSFAARVREGCGNVAGILREGRGIRPPPPKVSPLRNPLPNPHPKSVWSNQHYRVFVLRREDDTRETSIPGAFL